MRNEKNVLNLTEFLEKNSTIYRLNAIQIKGIFSYSVYTAMIRL
jgi:hypothetical protein